MPSYEEALTAFAETRSLLARAEDAMQNAMQVGDMQDASSAIGLLISSQAEQQKVVELKRELAEAVFQGLRKLPEVSVVRPRKHRGKQ